MFSWACVALLLACALLVPQAGSDSRRALESELANEIMHTLSPATFAGSEPEAAVAAAAVRSRVRFGGWHGDGEHAAKIAAYERAEEQDQAARQQGVTRIWTRARFKNSSLVTALSGTSAPALLRQNLPFAVFMLCDCPRDMDWHLPKLEHLLRENADDLHLLERLVLVYTMPSTAAALELHTMYGASAPALVIDNVPKGARNERYHFSGNNTSPPEETYRFMAQFVNGSASPTLAGTQSGHHSLRYRLADILAMHGDDLATAQAVEMLEDDMEIAARDGSDSDKHLLEAHAGHLCMLYLEAGTEESAARAAELHAQYPSAQHCASSVVRHDCKGEWSPCSELCEVAERRQWTEHGPASGGGTPCPSAVDCQPGEGACSPADVQAGLEGRERNTPTVPHRIASQNTNAGSHILYNDSDPKTGTSGHSQNQQQEDATEKADEEADEETKETSTMSPSPALPPPPRPVPPAPQLALGEAASLAAFRQVAKRHSDGTASPGAVGELLPQTVNRYLKVGRPFVVFILCSCERDTDWHIQTLSEAVQKRPELHELSIMWASLLTTKRFQLTEMYGVAAGEPAMVIDNIPYGPMNERYVFKHTPALEEHDRPPGKSLLENMLAFLTAFVNGTLQPDMRSAPAPDGGVARGPKPGTVTEVVGSTFESLVRDWVPAVPPLTVAGLHQPKVQSTRAHGTRWTFMFFYSRTCPACNEAMPTIEQLASDLKDYAFLNDAEPERPLLHIARVEKPFNDFAYRGLMITHYPTAYLFGVDEYDETTSVAANDTSKSQGERSGRMQAFAYSDYSGENAPHDHHHGPLDHWRMDILRHFIEEVASIPAETQAKEPRLSSPPAPQELPLPSARESSTPTGNAGNGESKGNPTKQRGAGWSHAKQLLQTLAKQLADPALGGASRLALEQHARALSQAEKRGWTEAELSKLRRNGYL